jgi:hypothetical protein
MVILFTLDMPMKIGNHFRSILRASVRKRSVESINTIPLPSIQLDGKHHLSGFSLYSLVSPPEIELTGVGLYPRCFD